MEGPSGSKRQPLVVRPGDSPGGPASTAKCARSGGARDVQPEEQPSAEGEASAGPSAAPVGVAITAVLAVCPQCSRARKDGLSDHNWRLHLRACEQRVAAAAAKTSIPVIPCPKGCGFGDINRTNVQRHADACKFVKVAPISTFFKPKAKVCLDLIAGVASIAKLNRRRVVVGQRPTAPGPSKVRPWRARTLGPLTSRTPGHFSRRLTSRGERASQLKSIQPHARRPADHP
jgi:hypothetical protein